MGTQQTMAVICKKTENQPIALLREAAVVLIKLHNNAAYHALGIILMSLDIHMEIGRLTEW